MFRPSAAPRMKTATRRFLRELRAGFSMAKAARRRNVGTKPRPNRRRPADFRREGRVTAISSRLEKVAEKWSERRHSECIEESCPENKDLAHSPTALGPSK